MVTKSSKVKDFEEKCQEFDYIRFTWADIHGISRGKTVPARNVSHFSVNGITAYAGSVTFGPRSELPNIPKMAEINYSNMKAVPDHDSLHRVPWAGQSKFRVGEVLCENHWIQDDAPMTATPRFMARKQLERLDELGYDLLSAFEMEFILFNKDDGKPVFDGIDIFCNVLQSQHESFLFDVDRMMNEAGVNVENFHIEYSPGQMEMVHRPSWRMRGADAAFIFKHGTKEIASQRGLIANFMSKPLLGVDGSGTHFNHSLWDKKTGKNVFHDGNDPLHLSEVARHWIGGLLKHIRALSAICAPTVNCYRRFHGPWAPDYADWGIEDRMSSVRAKASSQKATYIENRIPSGSSNPYLVLAATLAAGIDGIVNKVPCPPQGREGTERLADSLAEALQDLQNDNVMVDALGEEFLEWFVAVKEGIEIETLKESDTKIDDEKALARESEMYSRFL